MILIKKDKFPDLDKLIKKEYLEGYKLKYNVNDSFFYMGQDIILSDKCIQFMKKILGIFTKKNQL